MRVADKEMSPEAMWKCYELLAKFSNDFLDGRSM